MAGASIGGHPLRARSRDFLLKLHDAVNERFGTRRAAGDVDVYRDDLGPHPGRWHSLSNTPPTDAHAPMEMTHLGSGIWS